MAEFDWHELHFVVQQMTLAGVLACAEQLRTLLDTLPDGAIPLTSQQAAVCSAIFMKHTPIEVYRDGTKLSDGTHKADGYTLVLPLQREHLDTLPDDLAHAIIETVYSVNNAVLPMLKRLLSRPADLKSGYEKQHGLRAVYTINNRWH